MTKQITIKLNEKAFKPLIEDIEKFTGGMVKSDSDLVAKCVFFTHEFMHKRCPEHDNMTLWDVIQSKCGKEKPEMILGFLKDYSDFCKRHK